MDPDESNSSIQPRPQQQAIVSSSNAQIDPPIGDTNCDYDNFGENDNGGGNVNNDTQSHRLVDYDKNITPETDTAGGMVTTSKKSKSKTTMQEQSQSNFPQSPDTDVDTISLSSQKVLKYEEVEEFDPLENKTFAVTTTQEAKSKSESNASTNLLVDLSIDETLTQTQQEAAMHEEPEFKNSFYEKLSVTFQNLESTVASLENPDKQIEIEDGASSMCNSNKKRCSPIQENVIKVTEHEPEHFEQRSDSDAIICDIDNSDNDNVTNVSPHRPESLEILRPVVKAAVASSSLSNTNIIAAATLTATASRLNTEEYDKKQLSSDDKTKTQSIDGNTRTLLSLSHQIDKNLQALSIDVASETVAVAADDDNTTCVRVKVRQVEEVNDESSDSNTTTTTTTTSSNITTTTTTTTKGCDVAQSQSEGHHHHRHEGASSFSSSSSSYSLEPSALSPDLLQGTIVRKGDKVEFVADNLEERIKQSSSPLADSSGGGATGSRRSSVRSTVSASSSSTTSFATSSGGVSHSPTSSGGLHQQSPDDIPPIDAGAVLELENHARRVADNLDLMMGNIKNNLHKMSAITIGCQDAYKRSVDITCDSVDTSIKTMYGLMAKCEELSLSMKPVDHLAAQIKEIKRILDLFETQLTEK